MQSWILEQAWVIGIGASHLAGPPVLAKVPGADDEGSQEARALQERAPSEERRDQRRATR